MPCEGVHTFFMKFALDLVYIDRKHVVRKTVANVPPWRLSLCLPAHSIVELPAGTIDSSATRKGDQLAFEPLQDSEVIGDGFGVLEEEDLPALAVFPPVTVVPFGIVRTDEIEGEVRRQPPVNPACPRGMPDSSDDDRLVRTSASEIGNGRLALRPPCC